MYVSQFIEKYKHNSQTFYWYKEDKEIVNYVDAGSNSGEEIYWLMKDNVKPKTINAFEPHPMFSEKLKNTYKNNSIVKIHNTAFWNENCEQTLYFKRNEKANNGGASLIKQKCNINHNTYVTVKCTDCVEFLRSLDVNEIQLLKLDIEGGEYKVLNHIIQSPIIEKINCIVYEDHERKIKNPSWIQLKQQTLDLFKKRMIFFVS